MSRLTPSRVRAFVLSFGIWAPIIYLLTYGQPVVPLPATVMTMAGGLAFGPFWGVPAALAGATARACSQFWVARLLGRQLVSRFIRGKVASLDEQIGRHQFHAVWLIRVIPNFPYDMQNVGLGFSKVRFAPYAMATCLGMTPNSVAYAYLGYSLTDPQQKWKLALAITLITVLTLVPQLVLRRRRARAAASAGRA